MKPIFTGFNFIALNVAQIKGVSGNDPSVNDLTLGYSLSTPDDEAPDMVNGVKAYRASTVDLESMPVGTMVLLTTNKSRSPDVA